MHFIHSENVHEDVKRHFRLLFVHPKESLAQGMHVATTRFRTAQLLACAARARSGGDTTAPSGPGNILGQRRDGNGSILGWIFAGFGFSGFEFGNDFLLMVFGFGAPKFFGFEFGDDFSPKIFGFGFGFGFSSVYTQCITVWSKNSYFT